MSKLSTYHHKDYSGGLNNSANDREIERHEASVLYNWDITKKGRLVKRNGITQTGNTIDASNDPDGLNHFLRTTGSKDMVTMVQGALYYLNTTTWDKLDDGFTANKATDFATCPINNKLYITNDTDNLHSWDRTSTTLNSCLTDLGSSVPNGDIIKWHKNHMFITGNATNPNRLYWSNIADPDTWDTTNDYIDMPGGGYIVSLADLGDKLVIFKDNSIHFLSGWGDTDWRITASSSNTADLDETVGIAGRKAHTRVGNEVWFMDNEGVIRRIYQTDFDAFRRDIISTKIDGTIANINKEHIDGVVATTWNDKVYFAVPTGASLVNDTVLVFDIKASRRTQSEAWTTYTGWNVKEWLVYSSNKTPELYFSDGSAGKIYQHTGDDDDGVAIDSRWDSKQDDYDKPERFKNYKYGYITGPNLGDIDVGIYSGTEGATYEHLGNLNLEGSGSKLGPTGSFLLGPTGGNKLGGTEDLEFKFYFGDGGGSTTGKTKRMSIRHNVINEQPIVYGYTIHYKLRVLR